MKSEIAYIYALLDPTSNDVRYIGKTVNPNVRLSTHISEAKTSTHKNHRIYWIKNLLQNNLIPIMKILKVCPLLDFEKYETEYIKIYKSDKLTNSDESGQGNKNRKRSIIDNAAKKISRTVYQFDLNGIFIKEYKSTRCAAKELSTSHGNISKCCNGIFNHSTGYIFKYTMNNEIVPISNPNAIRKIVIEIDINGNEINRWKSIMDCSRDTKIDSGNISRVCNNRLKSTKNRKFKFI